MVELLLEAGAKVDNLDRDGQTALALATENQHAKVVEQLKAAMLQTAACNGVTVLAPPPKGPA